MGKLKININISKEEFIEMQIKANRKHRRETDGSIPSTKVHSDKRERRKRNRKEEKDKAIKESTT